MGCNFFSTAVHHFENFIKKYLSQYYFILLDFNDEIRVMDIFSQLSPAQWHYVSQNIGLYEHCNFIKSLFTLQVNKRVLFALFLQKVDSIEKVLNLLSSSNMSSYSGELAPVRYSI